MSRTRQGDVLLEFHQIGAITRVCAIDSVTNTEVVIQGPTAAGQAALTRTAVAKLRYVLAKKSGDPQGPGKRGVVV